MHQIMQLRPMFCTKTKKVGSMVISNVYQYAKYAL